MTEIWPDVVTEDQLKKYSDDGFLVVPDFLTEEQIKSLKTACWELVEKMDPSQHSKTVFTSAVKSHARNDYFLESGDKVRFFFEEEALDDNGDLKVDKHLALNKIGHALHWWQPEFKAISFSPKVKGIVKQLGFKSPALVQSMYIFKQPRYGGEVTPHKDCTFLSTEPETCVGLWFALEDATELNGCLWFSPGSQNTPTSRRFIRNPEKNGPLTLLTGPPDPHDPGKYIAVPVNKGSLVVINGQVDHMSAKNESNVSRHIYTFHVIERERTVWDPRNWLQPTESLPFTGLFENSP